MTTQVAYSIIEEQEGRIKRVEDDYMSFVAVLADPRYCGKSIDHVFIILLLLFL